MKLKKIVNSRSLNLIILFSLFSSLVIIFYQYNLTDKVSALFYGNNLIMSAGNISSFSEATLTSIQNGNIYVLWVDKNGINFSSHNGNDTSFTRPIILSSNNTISSSPRLMATENGYVYAVWVEKNNDTNDTSISNISNVIFRKSSDYGNTFDPDSQIIRNLGPNQTMISAFSPQIAATEKGNVYVVWVEKNNDTNISNVIFKGSYDNGHSFDPGIPLNRNTALNHKGNVNPNPSMTPSFSPQIAATEKGNVYVVWVEKKEADGDTSIVYANSNSSGKQFTNKKYIRANNLLSTSPQIAATEKGNVYVVWVDKNNKTGTSTIMFRTSNDSGNNFEKSDRLSRNPGPNHTLITSFSPQIAATNKGGVYVVFVEKNNDSGTANIVFRRSNDNGNDFDNTIRLNRIPGRTSLSFSPQVAATEAGKVFVSWPEKTLQFKEAIDDGQILGRTISLSNGIALPSSNQISVTENGNVYLIWSEKYGNITNNDYSLVFKKISESYFNRNRLN